MGIKQSHKPQGYKELLVYQKASQLLSATTALTSQFPRSKTMAELADQLNRSARSVKQNIAEGWKRNTTREYNDFLGFSAGSAIEVQEDAEDIWVGKYRELETIKGVVGEKRVEGVQKGVKGDSARRRQWLELLSFHPLDKNLPPVVQLYLRAKETCYFIDRVQHSLQAKMEQEYGLTQAEKLAKADKKKRQAGEWFKQQLADRGQVLTAKGVKDKEEARRLGLEEIEPQ